MAHFTQAIIATLAHITTPKIMHGYAYKLRQNIHCFHRFFISFLMQKIKG